MWSHGGHGRARVRDPVRGGPGAVGCVLPGRDRGAVPAGRGRVRRVRHPGGEVRAVRPEPAGGADRPGGGGAGPAGWGGGVPGRGRGRRGGAAAGGGGDHPHGAGGPGLGAPDVARPGPGRVRGGGGWGGRRKSRGNRRRADGSIGRPPGTFEGIVPRPISRADVEHVARLARLALTDEELARFQAQLSVILEEADKIRRLPTEGVPPTAHPLPRVNVWREDVPGPCLTREEALSTAPEVEQDRFKVPRIIEEAP